MSFKILVVEDDRATLKALTATLEKGSYEVITAENGLEGFEKTKKELPDLIVTDVVMPEIDGFLFYKSLKMDEFLQEIPVIILTDKAESEEEFRTLGVDDFFKKPFQPDKLLNTISDVLKKDNKEHIVDKSVLIVGSMDNIIQDMISILRQENCGKSHIASDIEDAIMIYEKENSDIVLVDMEMEGMSIFETVEKFRTVERFENKVLLVYQYRPDRNASNSSSLSHLLTERADMAEDGFLYMGVFNEEDFVDKVVKCLAKIKKHVDIAE